MATNVDFLKSILDTSDVLSKPGDEYGVTSTNDVLDTEDTTGKKAPAKSPANIYFDIDGTYLGTDSVNEDTVYVVGKVFIEAATENGVTKWDEVNQYAKKAFTGIEKFIRMASTVYGESSASLGSFNANEIFAIASVYMRNSEAYGGNNDAAKRFRGKKLLERNNNQAMKTTIAGTLNALDPEGLDLSYGATMWDGQEQSFYPETETRGWVDLETSKGPISIELHMNTMGWNIEDSHYTAWQENVGSKFLAPQKRVSPDNYTKGIIRYNNKGLMRLHSTAVYGKTIFWKEI